MRLISWHCDSDFKNIGGAALAALPAHAVQLQIDHGLDALNGFHLWAIYPDMSLILRCETLRPPRLCGENML